MSEPQSTYMPEIVRNGLRVYKTDRTASGDVINAVHGFLIANGHAGASSLHCNSCVAEMMNRAVNIFLKEE